jgi:predicted amidohydrolase
VLFSLFTVFTVFIVLTCHVIVAALSVLVVMPQEHWPLERILPMMTSNPARLLKLRHKGCIAVGADADLLVLSHDTLRLQWVYTKGIMRKSPQWTQGGFFERGSKIRPYHPFEEEDDKDF